MTGSPKIDGCAAIARPVLAGAFFRAASRAGVPRRQLADRTSSAAQWFDDRLLVLVDEPSVDLELLATRPDGWRIVFVAPSSATPTTRRVLEAGVDVMVSEADGARILDLALARSLRCDRE